MSQGASVTASTPVHERAINAQLQARRAEYALSVSKYVKWGSAATAILCVVLWLFFRQYTQVLWSAVTFMLMAAGAAVYPILSRQDRERLGIGLMLGSMYVALPSNAYLLPEALPALGVGYMLLLLMGYRLLGARASNVLMVLCVFGFVADVALLNTIARDLFVRLGEGQGAVVGALLALATSLGGALIIGGGVWAAVRVRRE